MVKQWPWGLWVCTQANAEQLCETQDLSCCPEKHPGELMHNSWQFTILCKSRFLFLQKWYLNIKSCSRLVIFLSLIRISSSHSYWACPLEWSPTKVVFEWGQSKGTLLKNRVEIIYPEGVITAQGRLPRDIRKYENRLWLSLPMSCLGWRCQNCHIETTASC